MFKINVVLAIEAFSRFSVGVGRKQRDANCFSYETTRGFGYSSFLRKYDWDLLCTYEMLCYMLLAKKKAGLAQVQSLSLGS